MIKSIGTVLAVFCVVHAAALYRLPQVFDNHCMDNDPYGWYHHPFFNETQVATVSLEIPQADIDDLLYGAKSNKYYPTSFSFSSPSGASFDLDKVGIRSRGASSRYMGGSKHSFTVDLSHYHSSPPWDLHKIALRAEPFDPTLSREFLTMDTLRAMGVCHTRKSYMRLEVNGKFWGLYVVKEVVGEGFLQSRYGLDDGAGMLYKLPGWKTTFQGQNFWFPALQELIYDKTPLKTYPASQDYAPLIHVSNILQFVEDEETFQEMIGLAVDVPLMLRCVAALFSVYDWDSLAVDGNNWYFALNTNVNQLLLIPTDFDQSFGMLSQFEETRCGHLYNASCLDQVPLYSRIMAVPAFRDMFTMYERALLETLMLGDNPPLMQRMESVRELIKPYATAPFFNDTSAIFPPSTFTPGFTQNMSIPIPHATVDIQPMIPFLDKFPPFVAAQLENTTSGPVIGCMHNWVFLDHPSSPVMVEVHSALPIQSVVLDYSTVANGGTPVKASMPMACNATTSAYSTTWTATVPVVGTQGPTLVFMTATVTDTAGRVSTWPSGGSFRTSVWVPSESGVAPQDDANPTHRVRILPDH